VTRRERSVNLSLSLTRRPSPSLPRLDDVVGGGVHVQDEAPTEEGKKIVPRKKRLRHEIGG
jgi:hypothetical protein